VEKEREGTEKKERERETFLIEGQMFGGLEKGEKKKNYFYHEVEFFLLFVKSISPGHQLQNKTWPSPSLLFPNNFVEIFLSVAYTIKFLRA
jgi:hypothetical protein